MLFCSNNFWYLEWYIYWSKQINYSTEHRNSKKRIIKYMCHDYKLHLMHFHIWHTFKVAIWIAGWLASGFWLENTLRMIFLFLLILRTVNYANPRKYWHTLFPWNHFISKKNASNCIEFIWCNYKLHTYHCTC